MSFELPYIGLQKKAKVQATPVVLVGPDGQPLVNFGITEQNVVDLASDGYSATATFVPAAASYGAGDIQDVAKEFVFLDKDGNPPPAGSLLRILSSETKIGVTSVPAGMTSHKLEMYGATPTGTPQVDNDLWAAAADDQTIYKGPVLLGSPVDIGAFLYVRTQYIDTDIRLDSGKTSLFGQFVTAGGHTATAVGREVTLHAMGI